MKKLISRFIAVAVLAAVLLGGNSLQDALLGNSSSVAYAQRSKEEAYELVSIAMGNMEQALKEIKSNYIFTPENLEKLEAIYKNGCDYIAQNELLESFSISSYADTVISRMEKFADEYGSADKPAGSTDKYIGLYGNLDVVRVKYGETCMVVLPFVNYSDVDLYNVVVEPQISQDSAKWPFEIDKTGYTQVIPYLPGNKTRDTVYDNRMEIGWVWTARSKEVKSGYYELSFDVTYERNGTTLSTTVNTFVYVTGSPDEDEKPAKVSAPRLVVTGFDTDPEMVFAGDTFTLTLHIQNTSERTAVSNILFNLEAQSIGTEALLPFLPTSGSSTVYLSKLKSKETTDISIEMSARADLSQKPYVLTVNMSYEDSDANPYTSQANVSIPIYQEAKFDISSFEVDPGYITIGEESNVMFNLYNTGKTTLYNVKVDFDQNEVMGGDTFLGKVEPGATKNVDASLIGAALNDGSVTVTVSYEDENGNVTSSDYEVLLMVDEAYFEEDFGGGFEEFEPEPMPEESSFPWLWVIIGAAVLVIAGVIVIVAVVKHNKKKKELASIEADSDDIL